MKISCKVVEDLLPLYHDGVCSEESRTLVEEHLKTCQQCSDKKSILDGEIKENYLDEKKPLEAIGRQVKRGKKKAILRGAAMMLALILILTAGWYGWWFATERGFYVNFAEGHDPVMVQEMDENGNVLSSVVENENAFQWSDETYTYSVKVPAYPGDTADVVVTRNVSGVQTEPVSIRNLMERVEMDVELGSDGEYEYHVSITYPEHMTVEIGEDGMNRTYQDDNLYFIVDGEMNQIYLEHWGEAYRARQDRKLEDYYEQVKDIVSAAKEAWPFLSE